MNKQPEDNDKWIRLVDPPCENGIIITMHEDGIRDVARMIDGVIYMYDVKTHSPIIAYKLDRKIN